ncbi:hypothetical protein JCM12856_07390 [Spirochaeta dissipatitropha]
MGIGRATVKRLLESGCSVAVWDYSREAIAEAGRVLGEHPQLLLQHCDIRSRAEVDSSLRIAEEHFGGIDILVNNAGTVVSGQLQDSDPDQQQRVIDINFSALVYLTRAVLPAMYERNFGIVVNISSAAGTLGVAGQSVYAATKWAVWGLTESLRHEAYNSAADIHFASVHPGYIAEGLFAGARIKGLGGLIVPLVRDHDVIARAIVEQAIRRRKTVVCRPRSVRLAVFLRGILPDRVFFRLVRLLNIHSSMEHYKGYS